MLMYEYGLPLTVVVLGIGFFICVTNSIFARINVKNPSTWKKQSAFATSKAWLTYAFFIAVLIGLVFIFAASKTMSGFSNLGKIQNSITEQQQQDMTTTEDSTDTTGN
jgi:flagellar biosynthesis/type III secretory pathway M-ring protein FliF/YscJ